MKPMSFEEMVGFLRQYAEFNDIKEWKHKRGGITAGGGYEFVFIALPSRDEKGDE